MLNNLERYILKAALVPASISLFIAGLLLILEQMLRLLDFVLNENGPVDVVWKMLAYLIPHYLSLALPLSVFLGIVLTVRKFSLTSERDAMLAVGVSPWRIMRPLWVLTLFGMAVNFLLLAYIQPYARYEFHQLRYELQAGLLGARVPVGKFVEISDNIRIRIGSTEQDGAELKDIFISFSSPDRLERSTFSAERGQFLRAGNTNTLILKLFNGRQMLVRDTERLPGVMNFKEQDLTIELPDVDAFRDRGGEKREVTLNELVRILDEENASNQPDYGEYRASFHFRIIHTLTFLALPFLGAALGVANKRRPSQSGPIMGLGLIILYHELLEEWGEHQVSVGAMSPYLAMWPLWVLFVVLAFHLFFQMSERAGQRSLWILDVGWPWLTAQILNRLPKKNSS